MQSLQLAQPQPVADDYDELSFEPAPKCDFVPLNFEDPKAAYQSKSNTDLLRTLLVLSACQFSPLASASPSDYLESYSDNL